MDKKVLKVLEFDKIIKKLSKKAITSAGKEIAESLVPLDSIESIQKAQKETSQALSMLLKKGSLPLGGLKDVRSCFERIKKFGSLSILEILNIGDLLHVTKKVLNYSKYDKKDEDLELVQTYFKNLSTIDDLEKEINRCILNENTIADNATPKLFDIRNDIKTFSSKVKETLNSIINSKEYKNMLQENVVTIRNSRFCVPIKQEYKNSFPGMIHDQSSTGITIFMEPIAVVSINNKIKNLINDEEVEIENILKNLSNKIYLHLDILENNFEVLTIVDFIFAKAEFSLEIRASEPIFNKDRYIDLKKARHPLIEGKVVPIDIHLGKNFDMLMITGPNTGGKTVSLKTLGLLTIMGQSGLHIPAFDNSKLAFLENIFVDIGDEQSIEQNLSTFSSHMTNIVKFLDKISKNSLVLLDELGAGTDPTEGAALAMSILQYIHKKKALSIVTTHYSELKLYALSTNNVENASCEFDIESLSPTYKLLIGIPGKSNAFAISRKLGLDEEIIKNAKQFVGIENIKMEDVLTELEIAKKNIQIEEKKVEKYTKEIESLKNQIFLQNNKLKLQKENILLKANEQAKKIVYDAKLEADNLIKQLQKQIREKNNFKDIESTRTILKQKLSEMDNNVKLPANKLDQIINIDDIIEGSIVYVDFLKTKANVLKINKDNSEILVQAGSIKTKVKLNQISKCTQSETKSNNFQQDVANFNFKKNKDQDISSKLDLRGKTVDESIEQVDKYLDQALIFGFGQVTIVHGKGTGVLRREIQKHLKNHIHVKNYRFGEFGEGDLGVTIVDLN